MRVAFVTETWRPHTDGIVTRLVATIRELRLAGHEVLVIAPDSPGDKSLDGVTVRTVPTFSWQFIYQGKGWGMPLPRVGRYLREFRPDVVHMVNPLMLGVAGTLAARRQGYTVVASYHTDVARYARHYKLAIMVPAIWATLRALHSRAHLNLATSTASISDLAEHGIENVRLWPRGVDRRLFRPGQPTEKPKPVALYVGRLASEKGLNRLAPLAEPDSGFQLVLVGDGPARADLEKSMPPSTIFTGLLHGEVLARAYQQADLFVFPSTTDTLGLVLLEALASGLPVLAADSPASRSILAECEAARLFSVDEPDQLPKLARELLDMPADVRADLARQQTAANGWESATEALLGFYEEAATLATAPNLRRAKAVINSRDPRRR